MAAIEDETTKKDSSFVEKSCAEITPSEKQRQQIRDRSGGRSTRQKAALWLGVVQVASYISLCVPLFIYKDLTSCDINIGMIFVYIVFAIAVIGHIFLIFTAIRKLRPGGLWIPMAVQISILALASVQLYIMVNLYSKISPSDDDAFRKEMCVSQQASDANKHEYRAKSCMIGGASCFLAFMSSITGFITNLLLYMELSEIQKEEHNDQNRLVVERQENRMSRLHSMIRLQEKREAAAANEGIKTAQEPVQSGSQNPADNTQPKSEAAKSKHRMIG